MFSEPFTEDDSRYLVYRLEKGKFSVNHPTLFKKKLRRFIARVQGHAHHVTRTHKLYTSSPDINLISNCNGLATTYTTRSCLNTLIQFNNMSALSRKAAGKQAGKQASGYKGKAKVYLKQTIMLFKHSCAHTLHVHGCIAREINIHLCCIDR